MIDPRAYWEERSRRYGSSPEGWKAVCHLGAPETFNRLLHRLQRHALRREMRIDRSAIWLDFGCGLGRWEREFGPRAGMICGVDISFEMLRRFHERYQAETNRGALFPAQFDGARLPFPDGVFDLVFSVTVLIHILEAAGLDRTVGEICRVAKPSGRIVIVESFAPEGHPQIEHVRFRPEAALVRSFGERGWRLSSSRSVYRRLPGGHYARGKSGRALLRLLLPWYYAFNLLAQALNLPAPPPGQKIQVYEKHPE
jgi:ubiquinone/menaquinone biosynthesis C-methylase UbiE